VRNSGLVGVGVVLGWLASKTWSDPGCQLGLVVFLVATDGMRATTTTMRMTGAIVHDVGPRDARSARTTSEMSTRPRVATSGFVGV